MGPVTGVLQNRVTNNRSLKVIIARVDVAICVCCNGTDDPNPSRQSRGGPIKQMFRCPVIVPDRVGTSTGSTLGVDTIEVSEGRADDELSLFRMAFEIGYAL